MMLGVAGLDKALSLCGVPKKAWHYNPKPRGITPDPEVPEMVQNTPPERPTYGTRYMAIRVYRSAPPGQPQYGASHIQDAGVEQARTYPSGYDPCRQEAPASKGSGKFWE